MSTTFFPEIITQFKDLHTENWTSLKDTLITEHEDIEFYFGYIIQMVNKIKTLRLKPSILHPSKKIFIIIPINGKREIRKAKRSIEFKSTL